MINELEKLGDHKLAADYRLKLTADILTGGTKGKPLFTKTEFLPSFSEYKGIAAEKDPEKHRAIRKAIAPVFSANAVREVDKTLHAITDEFINKLEQLGGKEGGVDISEVIPS